MTLSNFLDFLVNNVCFNVILFDLSLRPCKYFLTKRFLFACVNIAQFNNGIALVFVCVCVRERMMQFKKKERNILNAGYFFFSCKIIIIIKNLVLDG